MSTTSPESPNATPETGVIRFAREVAQLAASTPPGRRGTTDFVIELGDRYAYLRPRDLWRPWRFLRQAASAPPVQLGTAGFRPDILDDYNPARHYTAFVWAGFWLPYSLAVMLIYAWEIAGYIRYRGEWSHADVLCGLIGVRHGGKVRRDGPAVLPGLIATELADTHQVDVAALLAEVNQLVGDA